MYKAFRTLMILLLAILVIAGCSSRKTAQPGDKVRVHYTGTFDDGTIFDSSEDREPIEFTVGSGDVIKGFDDGVTGMAVGETRNITIPADEAYGQRRDELVVKLNRADLPETPEPEVGKPYMARFEDGRMIQGMILDIKGDSVTIDANHPLAGKTLNFELKLVEIL